MSPHDRRTKTNLFTKSAYGSVCTCRVVVPRLRCLDSAIGPASNGYGSRVPIFDRETGTTIGVPYWSIVSTRRNNEYSIPPSEAGMHSGHPPVPVEATIFSPEITRSIVLGTSLSMGGEISNPFCNSRRDLFIFSRKITISRVTGVVITPC